VRKFFKHFACERANVFEPVRACANQQHCNSKFPQVLLACEFPIHSNECVELLFRERKQITILNSSPASARYRIDFVTDQIVRESPINDSSSSTFT
jgi:hypothetical protein